MMHSINMFGRKGALTNFRFLASALWTTAEATKAMAMTGAN